MDEAERMALKERLKRQYRATLFRDVLQTELALAQQGVRIPRLRLVRQYRSMIMQQVAFLQDALPARAEVYGIWLQAYHELMDELLRKKQH